MSNCENCKECTEVEKTEKKPETVPYIVYEAALDRETRHTKKWMIAFFVVLAMLFATNVGWIIYESQFETYYYDQDGEGVNIVGDENEVRNNESTPEVQTEAQQ